MNFVLSEENIVLPMQSIALRVCLCSWLLAALSGCPKPPPVECIDGTEETCDAGTLPPDLCNSKEEAQADSVNCHLNVTTGGATPVRREGVYLSRLADGGVDQDWYFAQLPGGLTPRTLLHINGGYQAPQTAVSFSINVFKEGTSGLSSVAAAADLHGAAAPKPVDIIVPFGESGAKLFALVADQNTSGQVRVDNRNTYSLYMELIENPDVNEPNDMMATPIALMPMGNVQQGSQTGFLATTDDVDQFSFQVTSTSRQIIYLRILGPDPHPTNPPPPYRLSYTLYDPGDRPISEGVMANEFLRIDLSTARLSTMSGTYKVKVSGYKMPNSTIPVRGDLRVGYTVEVQLLPDVDAQEPNDTAMGAKAVSGLSANSRLSLTGKLSYVADEEWFRLSLPAHGTPSTFRYRLTAATTGGRFPPLSGTPARQLRVTKQVTTGTTAQDRQVACRTNQAVCPKAADGDPQLVDALCNASDPPQCLYAQRNEELPRLPMLRNMVGALPVPVGQPVELLVMFRDEGLGASKYADDRDWTLELEWRDDPDEASRLAGPTMIAVRSDGGSALAQGELTYGYGKYLDSEYFNSSTGLRGRNDYDAFDTDKDLFQFSFPPSTVGDQSWEVSWELLHPDAGGPPGDIALELTFCGAGPAADGGLCAQPQLRIFAFNDDSLTPWYLPQSASNGRMLFSKQTSVDSTTITALPVGCWCFSAARVDAGAFYANVAAVHRTSNAPIRYRVSQRIAPYPGSFTASDGGTGACPVVDAGCGFAR